MDNFRIISIGVSNYDDEKIINLPPCDKEADDVFNVFTSDNIGICTANESTILKSSSGGSVSNRSNIISKLDHLSSLTEEDEGLLMYFSGHGHEINGENYLIAKDTSYSSIENTSIPLTYIYEKLRESKAKSKILIIDCCKPGFLIGKSISTYESIENQIKKLQDEFKDDQFIVMTSCKAKQVSHLLEDKSESVFTHYLLRGLKGEVNSSSDEFITVHELYEYLKDEVRRWSISNNAQQVPFISYEGSTIEEITIAKRTNKPTDKFKIKIYPLNFGDFEIERVKFYGSRSFMFPVKLVDRPRVNHLTSTNIIYSENLFGSNKMEVIDEDSISEYKEMARKHRETKLTQLSAKLVNMYDVESFKKRESYSFEISFENGYVSTGVEDYYNRADCTFQISIGKCDSFEKVIQEFENSFKWDGIEISCSVKNDKGFIKTVEHIKKNNWKIVEYDPFQYILFEFEPLGKESNAAKIKIKNGDTELKVTFNLSSISSEHDLKALLSSMETIISA